MTDQDLERLVAAIRGCMEGIVPERIYTPEEAAELIGFRGERAGKSIREIPRDLLPLIPITPGGRIVGYYGRDLIGYIESRRATVVGLKAAS